MRRTSLTALILGLILIATPAWAATYFVNATGGSDTNDGLSEGAAWQTLSKVNGATFSAGDIIQFKRGEIWRESFNSQDSGSSGNPIIYRAYGTGATPSIRGSDTYNSAGNWTDGGSNQWYASSIANDPGVFVHDGTLGQRKTSLGALATQWDYFWDSGTSRLYVYSTANPTTLASLLEIAIRENFQTFQFWNHVTYEDLDFRHYRGNAAWGVFAGGADGTTWRRVTIAQVAGYGMQCNTNGTASCDGLLLDEVALIDWAVGNRNGGLNYGFQVIGANSGPIDIEDSTATINVDNGSVETIAFVQDQGGWIRNLRRTTFRNPAASGNASSMLFWRPGANATSILVEDNDFQDAADSAIHLNELNFNSPSITSVIVRRNLVTNAGIGDSLDIEAIRIRTAPSAFNVQVYANVVNGTFDGTNAHECLKLNNVIDADIWHNTLVACDDGIRLENGSTGAVVQNNVLANNRGWGLNLLDTSTTATRSHNGVFNNSSGNYSSGTSSNDVTSAPLFIGAPDLRPQCVSPLVAAGAGVGVTLDRNGLEYQSAPTIGAYRRLWCTGHRLLLGSYGTWGTRMLRRGPFAPLLSGLTKPAQVGAGQARQQDKADDEQREQPHGGMVTELALLEEGCVWC